MNAECTPEPSEFHELGRRDVVGKFDGGNISSDGGGLFLREQDKGKACRVQKSDRAETCCGESIA